MFFSGCCWPGQCFLFLGLRNIGKTNVFARVETKNIEKINVLARVEAKNIGKTNVCARVEATKLETINVSGPTYFGFQRMR